jgi:16S rRNA (guanine527-N7)-methyltransferase
VELLESGARSLLGLCLTVKHLAAFQLYYEELAAWNQRFNLTALTSYRDVQLKHFLDSLTCLLALPAKSADTCAPTLLPDKMPIGASWEPLLCLDVGTGAGFPGLPLKIIRPEIKLTLLEATEKKTTFLRHIVKRMGLDDVEIITGRAEELGQDPHHRERYDVVLARAVADLSVLAEYCLPFCRVGGRFVAQKGDDIERETSAAQRALSMLGGDLCEVKKIELLDLLVRRSLVLICKTAATPADYPRRPGIPSKRPLR